MKEERNIHDFLKPQRGKVKQGYFTPMNNGRGSDK